MRKAKRQQGSGYEARKQLRSQCIRWEDVQFAFRGRIRTGLSINLKHTDPLTFLEDAAYYMFTIRTKNVLKAYYHLKVNVVICGLFEKETADQVVEEVKHFPTPNHAIDGGTDLKEWWAENVQDGLIITLADFQVIT